MFNGATAFNQNLGNWTLNANVSMDWMLNGSGMDCANYSATLNGWAANNPTVTNRNLGATGRQYGTNAAAARTLLTGTRSWTISGDQGLNTQCLPCSTNSILYVNQTATGDNTGDSWANAFTDLQDALYQAVQCPNIEEIWVAAGTYKPTTGTDRSISFVMKNNLAIYGGFPNAGNPAWADRDWATNLTILSGDIGAVGDISDNSFHVIFNSGLDNTAILDGFTITEGNANGEFNDSSGGGMFNIASSPKVVNCTLIGNSGRDGAGIYGSSSYQLLLVNCSFVDNSAENGGGIFFSSSQASVINCSFFNNSADSGGDMFLITSIVSVVNSILWGNSNGIEGSSSPSITYSIVQGGYSGIGNLDMDPLFVDAANGNLRLQSCSPAINAGDNDAVPTCITTDLDGNPRFFNVGIVDMGAYEFQGEPTPVTAICQNQTISLDNMGQVILNASELDNGSSGCGTLVFSIVGQSSFSYTCTDIGPKNVTLTVTDERNITSTCTATVTVVDNTPPIITCQNHTVNLDGMGNATITPSDVYSSGSDNCGTANLVSVVPNMFTCADLGPNVVTLTVNDGNGNTSTCTATVTVADNTPPVLTCQNHTVNLDAMGNATISPSDVYGTGSDNCGTVNLVSVVPNVFTCADLGPNVVTLTVNDGNGNMSTCTATVTVVDNTPPVITCQNHTVNLDAMGNATITPSDVYGTGSDNCGTVNLVSVVPNMFTCADLGPNVVTLTVNDGNGNTSTCTATVTVVDNTPPVITCQNQTVNLNGMGNATITPSDVYGTGSDNCGTVNLVSVVPNMFTCADLGPNVVTLTVNDGNGNTSTCTATVTVVDNIPPVLTCQNHTVNLDVMGNATISPLDVYGTGSDNCGTVNLVSVVPNMFTCADLGPNVVTLTVNDGNGNTSTCTATVTVEDNIFPTLQCFNQTITFNGEQNINLDADDLVAASDNCAIQSVVLSPPTISSEQVGQTVPVNVSVTDVGGNTSGCISQITVTGLPTGWSQNPNGIGCNNGNNIGYNAATNVWTATSTNCFSGNPFNSDAMAFAQQTLCGNGSITAQVTGISGTALGWAGVSMRENNSGGAKKAQLLTNMTNFSRREFRTVTGGSAIPQQFLSPNRYWLRLARSGNQFSMHVSADGVTWFFAGAQNIVMPSCIETGLVLTNYTSNSTVSATFSNVTVVGSGQSLVTGDPVSMDQHNLRTSEVTIYPNPAQSEAWIEIGDYSGEEVSIQIRDINGRIIYHQGKHQQGASRQRLDLSGMTSGVYMVEIDRANYKKTIERLVVIGTK